MLLPAANTLLLPASKYTAASGKQIYCCFRQANILLLPAANTLLLPASKYTAASSKYVHCCFRQQIHRCFRQANTPLLPASKYTIKFFCAGARRAEARGFRAPSPGRQAWVDDPIKRSPGGAARFSVVKRGLAECWLPIHPKLLLLHPNTGQQDSLSYTFI
jgi:hypothetical protein